MARILRKWSVACPRCKAVTTSASYACNNCRTVGRCLVEYHPRVAPSATVTGVANVALVKIAGGSSGGTYFLCAACETQQGGLPCRNCGTDLLGLLKRKAERTPLWIILTGIGIVIAVWLFWAFYHSTYKAPMSDLGNPVPVSTINGVASFNGAALQQQASKGPIRIEGNAIIHGGLDHVTIKSSHGKLTIEGPITHSAISIFNNGTIVAPSADRSTLCLDGDSTVDIQNVTSSFIWAAHLKVQTADHSNLLGQTLEGGADTKEFRRHDLSAQGNCH